MQRVTITFAGVPHEDVWRHLLSNGAGDEEAAFLFANVEATPRAVVFHVREWHPVQPSEFAMREIDGIELTDTCRAAIFKRAHDTGTSLIECHSHPGNWPAAFSGTDVDGFREFIPHVFWRLKGRPYAAIVVASTTFDAIAWIERPDAAVAVDVVTSHDRLLHPTRMSLNHWEVLHGRTV